MLTREHWKNIFLVIFNRLQPKKRRPVSKVFADVIYTHSMGLKRAMKNREFNKRYSRLAPQLH